MATGQASIPLRDATGALQTRLETARFMQSHAPYDAVPEDLLIEALAGARLGFYERGQALIGPEDGVPDHFCVVMQGLILGQRQLDDGSSTLVFESGAGETFLNVALWQQRPTQTWHEAGQDSFVIEIPRRGFDLLFAQAEAFRAFCERRASVLVDQLQQQIRAAAGARAADRNALDSPLKALMRGAPLVCSPQCSIVEAVRRMHERRVGSIVVVDDSHHPKGIFTLHDLRAQIAAGLDLSRSIDQAMTPRPIALEHKLPAFEAAMAMADHEVGHVLVTAGDVLVGVVSQRDLFALQRIDVLQMLQAIGRAAGITELAPLQMRIQGLVHAMLAHGASSRQLTRLIARVNDALVVRVIDLVVAEAGPLPRFSWLSFGSEARGEQTFSTDQDNGIVFVAGAGESEEAARARLLPVATKINQMLDRIGFPLCRGKIMASNPELCLSVEEWRIKLGELISLSTPENLLRATILFDPRVVWGDPEPLQGVLDTISAQARTHTRFQRALAQHALEWRPPLGLLRDFVTHRSAEGRSLDLKTSGLQIFVSAARVLALSEGVRELNTEDRLMAVAATGRIKPRDAEAWAEAFALIQQLRMRGHQAQLAEGRPLSNELVPDSLNPLERRILKEALRQAQRLQTRLKLDYP